MKKVQITKYLVSYKYGKMKKERSLVVSVAEGANVEAEIRRSIKHLASGEGLELRSADKIDMTYKQFHPQPEGTTVEPDMKAETKKDKKAEG